MKVYSWNMLFKNPDLDRAFEFIQNSDFDLFCLQEVPDDFLARLRTLDCHLARETDVIRLFVPTYNHNHVVVLSRYPIERSGRIPYPDYWEHLPWRTRLFVACMKPFGFSRIKDRGGLWADVRVGETLVRVFNLHLVLAHPLWRFQEFEKAMIEHDPDSATIVCGDFNILESPHITPLNWLLGGTVSDALLYRRERTHIESRFAAHELTNVLRGRVTHPFTRSQLDHILVSRHFTLQSAQVITDSHGSDHQPIVVEVKK